MKTNHLVQRAGPTASTCFRLFLQKELGRHCAANPQYSLRAFAKYLTIDHATLSQLLRGKRPLTDATIRKLGIRLGLDAGAIKTYTVHEHLEASRQETKAALPEVQQLAQDTANLIADWYHYAILELTRLREFKPDSRWIGRVLGISTDDVNIAVTRLVRLGLLEMTARDCWTDTSGDTTANLEDLSYVAVQKLFEQVRRLLLNKMGVVPAGHCHHSATTLAIPNARVIDVIELIEKCQRELLNLLDQDQIRDDVYQLEISFFPVTTLIHTQENADGSTRDAMANRGQRSR